MATRIPTAIGRVIPFYVGEWQENQVYEKLDNVLYNGSTYMALRTVPSTVTQPDRNPTYWQLIAKKGDTGGIGNVVAAASASNAAYASATVTGDDPSAMNFIFEFGLPKGDTGDPAAITGATATASQLGYDDPPTASVVVNGDPTAATLSFFFGIPGAAGGVSKVDGVNPILGDVPVQAVSFGIDQTDPSKARYITPAQASQARANINAQVAGNYIADPSASTGQFLRFNNEGNWVGESINLVPTGAVSDIGKYLRKTNSGMLWAEVQSLPSAGDEGAPLVKYSATDYDVTWGTFISTSEIDEIIEA